MLARLPVPLCAIRVCTRQNIYIYMYILLVAAAAPLTKHMLKGRSFTELGSVVWMEPLPPLRYDARERSGTRRRKQLRLPSSFFSPLRVLQMLSLTNVDFSAVTDASIGRWRCAFLSAAKARQADPPYRALQNRWVSFHALLSPRRAHTPHHPPAVYGRLRCRLPSTVYPRLPPSTASKVDTSAISK